MVFFNSIGNCYCRKNMSTCATACNDEAKRPPRPSKGGSCVIGPPRPSEGGSCVVWPPRPSEGGSCVVWPPRPSGGGSCVVTLIWFCVAQYFCLLGWGVLLFCCFVLGTLVTLVTEVATSLLTTHHVELTIHYSYSLLSTHFFIVHYSFYTCSIVF